MNEGSKLEEITDSVMHLVKGTNILDVGTGYGTVITRLLRMDGTKVTSIDPEAWTFADIEKEFAREIDQKQLRLLKVKAEHIPFEDKTFDTAIVICSLHHLRDPLEGMKEIERVTSERIIVADWGPSSGGEYNPHSPEELKRNMEKIVSYAIAKEYHHEEKDKWFLVWK